MIFDKRAPWTTAVAVPVAVFLMCLWFLHDRPEYGKTRVMGPIAAALILLTPLSGHAVLLTGTVLTALVGVKLVVMGKAEKAAGSVPP